MLRHSGKPTPPSLDEFKFVQPGSFFCPPLTFGNRFNPIDQTLSYPVGLSFPRDICDSMIKMYRSRQTVQSETPPIPKFEGEDVRRSANLKHHAAFARAMNRAGGNKKVIMFAGGESVYVIFRKKRRTATLSSPQFADHRIPINSSSEPEVHTTIFGSVQHVVAFILRVIHSKMLPNIFWPWMHLKRQVSAPYGVQEIKADGELRAEARVNKLSQKLPRLEECQIDSWNLDTHVAKPEQEAVLFRNAVETPRMIRHIMGQITDFLHPVSAPRSGVEIRHNPVGPIRDLFQTGTQAIAADQLRWRIVCIQKVVGFREKLFLQPVGCTPVHKEGSFVFQARTFVEIVRPEV